MVTWQIMIWQQVNKQWMRRKKVSAYKQTFPMITAVLVTLSAADALDAHYDQLEASAASKLVLFSPDIAIMFISLRMRPVWLIYLFLQSAGKWNLYDRVAGNSVEETYNYGPFES